MADETADKTLNLRVTQTELDTLETLRRRMQERAALGSKVTQRMVVLAALERLRAHLDRLDRDRGRER